MHEQYEFSLGAQYKICLGVRYKFSLEPAKYTAKMEQDIKTMHDWYNLTAISLFPATPAAAAEQNKHPVCVCVCVCVYVCECVRERERESVCVCVYIYVHIHCLVNLVNVPEQTNKTKSTRPFS